MKYDIERVIKQLIDGFPVTAILGARQCGKTTIAGQIKSDHSFDLENPRDELIFENPQLTLERLEGLIVLDEVQRSFLVETEDRSFNCRENYIRTFLEHLWVVYPGKKEYLLSEKVSVLPLSSIGVSWSYG